MTSFDGLEGFSHSTYSPLHEGAAAFHAPADSAKPETSMPSSDMTLRQLYSVPTYNRASFSSPIPRHGVTADSAQSIEALSPNVPAKPGLFERMKVKLREKFPSMRKSRAQTQEGPNFENTLKDVKSQVAKLQTYKNAHVQKYLELRRNLTDLRWLKAVANLGDNDARIGYEVKRLEVQIAEKELVQSAARLKTASSAFRAPLEAQLRELSTNAAKIERSAHNLPQNPAAQAYLQNNEKLQSSLKNFLEGV